MQTQLSYVNLQAEPTNLVRLRPVKKIMIVDDCDMIISSLPYLFEPQKNQIEIVYVQSVPDAIKEYNAQKFDVIVLDHRLGESLGFEFIKATNAQNIYYYSGGYIHKNAIWPYKNNIIDVYEKTNIVQLHKDIIEKLGLEYDQDKSKLAISEATEDQRSQEAFKGNRQYRRDFKKVFGSNQNEFFNGKDGAKIGLAKKLLREGNTVEMVTRTLKYAYRKNFERFFKRNTGMTPGKYRNEK